MHYHAVTAEIGSTITKVNSFSASGDHIGQGFALTSIDSGDVSAGLKQALENMSLKGLDFQGPDSQGPDSAERVINRPDQNQEITWDYLYANSSAAGGLKMTVHGLTMDMTSRAAREASLGAGAIVKLITAGKLRESKLVEIADINPNIILLAGGVDYGEEEVILHNAGVLKELNKIYSQKGISKIPPLVYAGNRAIRAEVFTILTEKGFEVIECENVYPGLDELNVEPARKVIMDIFSRHIIHAPGMSWLETRADNSIIPTPAAVLKCTELIYENYGDTAVIDVGGATTDIHSVTEGSDKYKRLQIDPEPHSKRTVEGDLGVFVNARSLNLISSTNENFEPLDLGLLSPLPETAESLELSRQLAYRASYIGLKRHAGRVKSFFISTGKKSAVKGRDLTGIKHLFGTGGAFTRLYSDTQILASLCKGDEEGILFPNAGIKLGIDRDYIFSAIGTIAFENRDLASMILKKYMHSRLGC